MSGIEPQTPPSGREFEPVLPPPVVDRLNSIKAFIKTLSKTYNNLAEWGKPFFTRDELISILYSLEHAPVTRISELTDISRVTLSKIKERYQNQKEICYLLEDRQTVRCEVITRDQVTQIVKEWLKPRKPFELEHVLQSDVLRTWAQKPLKITRRQRLVHSEFFTEKQVKEILRTYEKVIRKMSERGFRITNPDIWYEVIKGDSSYGITKEELEREIVESVKDICRNSENPSKCRYSLIVKLRAVKTFHDMGFLKGYAGSVRRTISERPLTSQDVLFYRDWMKVKHTFMSSDDNELRACAEIMSLHIESGAREGYSSLLVKSSTLLDDAPSSLIGIKLDDIVERNGEVEEIKIFESKTEDTWKLKYFIINPELKHRLVEIKRKYEGRVKSLVRAILIDHGISSIETVEQFRRFYSKCLREASRVIGREITPHRIRASHISILAELGIPLELAITKRSGFGAGWSDLSTAFEFYYAISQQRIKEIVDRAIETRRILDSQS